MREVPRYRVISLNPKKFKNVLLIPVINEGQRITKQLIEISEANIYIDVVIADGGSSDDSLSDLAFLKEIGVRAILVKEGAGKLSAQLRMGFDFSLLEGYENILTMDGNGKDRVTGVNDILNFLIQGDDFVQGSRYIEGGMAINTPKYRDLAIRYFHAPITSLAARRRFTDTTNGFRGFSRRLLESSDMSIFRDIFDTYELIFYIPIRASRLGFKTREVPVVRAYPDSGFIPTKIIGINSYLELIRILIKAAAGHYNPQG